MKSACISFFQTCIMFRKYQRLKKKSQGNYMLEQNLLAFTFYETF